MKAEPRIRVADAAPSTGAAREHAPPLPRRQAEAASVSAATISRPRRIFIYVCPCCRIWFICESQSVRERCVEAKACLECVGSHFIRLRCHIARIRASLGGDGIIAGRVAATGKREVYASIYRKRQAMLAAARQRLIDAGADGDSALQVAA